MDNPLAEFPITLQLPIAWGEMDALGHVNNIVYFRYFESARIAYFDRLKFMEQMKKTQVGPILRDTQCRFRIPLTYPGTIQVGARVKEVLEYGFVHQYCVAVEIDSALKIAAEGEGTLITFNYQEKKKVPLPAEILEHIEKLEGKKFEFPKK